MNAIIFFPKNTHTLSNSQKDFLRNEVYAFILAITSQIVLSLKYFKLSLTKDKAIWVRYMWCSKRVPELC